MAVAALFALGPLAACRLAGATSCGDFARSGSTGIAACPLAPRVQPIASTPAPAGPREIDELAPHGPIPWSALRPGGAALDELRNRRSIVEADQEERDCHGSLCGPQSFTLRVGMPVPGSASTFSPMIGGLGAVIGATALSLKPGPRPERASGPSLDGWGEAPKGLKPGGPPFTFSPLMSINNREGGLRFLLNW